MHCIIIALCTHIYLELINIEYQIILKLLLLLPYNNSDTNRLNNNSETCDFVTAL